MSSYRGESVHTNHARFYETAKQSLPLAHTIQFKGTGAEYFRIWIANLALTVITLGIYSAWAKVRTLKYFYNNTFFNDTALDYIANPIAILKGRIIAVVISCVLYFTAKINLYWALGATCVFIAMTPWVVVRSLMFHAHNTTYRNVRFRFEKNLKDARRVFIGWYVLALMTIGLLFPLFAHRRQRFITGNLSYGQSRFTFHAPLSGYYTLYGTAVLWIAFIIAFCYAIQLFAPANYLGHNPAIRFYFFAILIYFSVGVVLFFYNVYLQTGLANLLWNNIQNGKQRFACDLKVSAIAWILSSNLALMLVTLGLYYPWAKVRMTQYKLNQLALHTTPEFNHIIAVEQEQQSAVGESLSDVFEMDISL